MTVLRFLVANILIVISAFTLADSIRGVTVGDHYSALAQNFTEGQIITYDDPIGKEYGFKIHAIDSEDVVLSARSLPKGELYHIGFAQLVPLKQADEFKTALCEKYAISPCEWDTTSLKTITGKPVPQFQGKRQAGDTMISVSITRARRPEQKGFVWAGAGISRGNPQDLVKRWQLEARLAEQKAKERAARAASEKADRVEIKF